MSNDLNNRKRAFAEVVSVEAWHKAFSTDNAKADLHADVVFGTARIGGEAESAVRFRLRMKRADIVVVISETEPVEVEKQSVSRDSPQLHAHFSKTSDRLSGIAAGANAGAKASADGVAISIQAQASARTEITKTEKIELSGDLGLMKVTQSKTSDGHYRWTIEALVDGYLDGRPWDGANAPRLKLIDRRRDPGRGIPPSVRVEVRCRREDIEILDLKIKDEGIWAGAKAKVGFQNRMKAAEAYIRDQLAREGLQVDNINDIFGELTFASTTAEPISE